jgi:hypothetical protein
MIKELIKIANELDSRGLVKEADALDDIIILSGLNIEQNIFEKEEQQIDEPSEVKCSEVFEGRKLEVIDKTNWTKEIVRKVTDNSLDASWGTNYFASGMCMRLKSVLERGYRGDSMNKDLYEAWTTIRGDDKVIIDFAEGRHIVYPMGISEPKSVIVASTINVISQSSLNLNVKELSFTIIFSRIGVIPELTV